MPPPLPRWAAALLSLRLSNEWREFVLGDLAEEYAARAAAAPAAARRWLLWQTLRCFASPPPAPRRLGAVPSMPRESHRMLQNLVADARYAFRSLARTPGFAVAAIGVLALGIGATTAIFSILNSVLLRPLPFSEPERLVRLFHVPPQATFPGIPRFSLSPANFYDWQRDAKAFESMAMYRTRGFTLTGSGTPRPVVATAVGAGFFDIVRGRAAQGRVFRPDEDRPGANVVVISDGFWRTQLGGRANVVGQKLRLDGQAFEIVGVMPASFSVEAWNATARDLWVPLALNAEDRAERENHNMQGVARLRPGADVRSAISELGVISTRLETAYPAANAGWGATVVPLQELIVGDIRATLVMLLAAVGLVLLIACANVGNLLFTRSLGRRKEVAIRAALGAGRGRVLQQLLTEAVVLALAAGAVGLLLAETGVRASAALLVDQVPRADEISLDWRVLLFVLGASVLTGMLAGVIPALRVGRSPLTDALKEGGRSEGAVGIRTRRVLVVGEVALSVVLLMGASVMVRSVLALRSVDTGFDADGVLTMIVALPEARYPMPAQRKAFFDSAIARMREIPGVVAAGAVDSVPFTGGSVQPIVVEGRPELLPRDQPTVQVRVVTPGYLETMRIPLLRGRDVAPGDDMVMLVSRSAARLLWQDADPLSQRVTLPLISRTEFRTVVGIVGDVKQDSLADAAPPTVYWYTRDLGFGGFTLVLRTTGDPVSVAAPAAAVVRSIDPEQPVQGVRTMVDIRDELLTSQRFSALLLAAFALTALVLASVGIYSVLSYIVRGRSREIGIRSALGAQTGDVLGLVVREGMTPALAGIGLGALAAVAASTILERLVFGVSASDPLTLAGVAAALAVVALAASLGPAWRASRIDPLTALRD
jgi:putative ABC transport system permease protein